jgi:hypothetical protein
MRKRLKAAAAVAAGLLVLGGGAALATNLTSDPSATSRAILERAADELGIGADELTDALKAGAIEQIEEALDAGDITEDQAEALRERLESSDGLFLGGLGGLGPWGHGGGFGGLHHGGPGIGFELSETAADYLGLSEEQVRNRLANGRSLAEIAEAEGKSVDGLVDALVDAQESALDEAVDAGRITESQADAMSENLRERIEFFVDRSMPPWGGPPGRHGFRSWR